MGTHYYIYAEIKVKDKWYNLNPYMKKPDGTYSICPIFDAGSVAFDVVNDLEDNRISIGIQDDMSPELRSIFHKNLDEPYSGWLPSTTWRDRYDQTIFCVNYSDTVGKRVIKNKPHKYEGYVFKRTIADFEVLEIEAIHSWLTREEFEKLSEKEKRKYRYYEWDEIGDEYVIYRRIYERLCAMLYWFDFGDAFECKRFYWDNQPTLDSIRLFVEST